MTTIATQLPGTALRTSTVISLWALTRALTVIALVVPAERGVLADIRQYSEWAPQVLAGHLAVGGEYPLAGLFVIAAPGLISTEPLGYLATFTFLMLLVDFCLTAALWRWGGPRRLTATLLWLSIVPALGPLALTRFDLLPAALAALSLLILHRAPARSAAYLSAGVAVKLWPIVVLPALLLRSPGRRRVLTVLLVSLGSVAAVTAWLAQADRIWSPLLWQRDRGLQVESLPALPLMWLHSVDPQRWRVTYAHGAWQVDGPGAVVTQTVAWAVLALLLVYLGRVWLQARNQLSDMAASLLATATLLCVVLTAKNLSPQYLLWVGAVLAVAAGRVEGQAWRGPLVAFVAACCLTQVVYPLTYLGLLSGRLAPLIALTVRDVTLLFVAATVFRALAGVVFRSRSAPSAAT